MTRGWLVAAVLLAAGPAARALESGAPLAIPERNLAAVERYSRQCGGQALLVLQAGRTIHESYARGGTVDRAIHVMSITKSLAALAVFAARADGLLTLDEPAALTLTEWKSSPGKKRITLRELLNQTSGLAPAAETIYRRGAKSKNAAALAAKLVTPPGERFDYGPANFEALEEILRRKLARREESPRAYLQRRVLTPLGVRPAGWRRDRSGREFFSAGAHLTARDLARVGEFVRTRGRVGIVPILPASAFEGAFTGSAANPMYGLSLWLNANAPDADPISIEGTLGEDRSPAAWRRSSLSNAAPRDVAAMIGSGGQRCYVVPSRRLVVVRFGDGANFSDAEFLRRLFAR